MSNFAPIAFFVYNRPKHTKISLEALKNNVLARDTDLIIFSEAAKENELDKIKVNQVRKIIENCNGFKSVLIKKRDKNFGLYKNFTEGITEVCNKFGKIIVVEDDNQVSKYFLKFINDGLDMYLNYDKVCSINGWFFPGKNDLENNFFLKGGDTWGWGTWKRAWKEFNPDTEYLLREIKSRKLIKKFNLNNSFNYYKMLEKRHLELNESHSIIWKASTFLKNMHSLYPAKSFVRNIGFDGSGTHNKKPDELYLNQKIEDYQMNLKKKEIIENKYAFKFVVNFHKKEKIKNLFLRIKKKLFNF